MPHQNFEKYALERSMDGGIADEYISFFKKHIEHGNPDLKVLDFGCGDGRYYPFLKQFFKEKNLYGIEVSEVRAERARSKGWSNVIVVREREPLPFENDFFDLINCDQVVEHVPRGDIDFYLRELSRILKPSGEMVVLTPNYPIKRAYDLWYAVTRGEFKKVFDDPTHVARYDFPKLSELLKKHFHKVELYPTGGFLYTKVLRKNFLSHKIIGVAGEPAKELSLL